MTPKFPRSRHNPIGFLLFLCVLALIVGLLFWKSDHETTQISGFQEKNPTQLTSNDTNEQKNFSNPFSDKAPTSRKVSTSVEDPSPQVERAKSDTPAKKNTIHEVRQEGSFSNHENRLSIASFNIRIFSNRSRSDEELDMIAKLLGRYDIVAIQELRDAFVLERTIRRLNELGYSYDYEISPPLKRSHERYAFLYRRNKVQLVKKGLLFQENPSVFIREPFYASFKSGNFDFTLLTVHLLYGRGPEDRRPEATALARVYKTINQNHSEKDLILLGDFNLPPDDLSFYALKSFPTMTYLIRPPEKTTITDTSLYDNFWFEQRNLREYSGLSGVNRFDETMFQNDDTKANLMVSDHRLIWSVYNTAEDDD